MILTTSLGKQNVEKLNVLKEAERLYALGFAILWLKPKSKIPVKAGWTTGLRENWGNLKQSYKPGYNLGVRLGTASQVKGGYLAAIDLDIKSTHEKHRLEAESALLACFPEAALGMVRVKSGRGNGSSHLYFVSKTPVKTKRLVVSPERVKVLMPSVQGLSRSEKTELTGNEISQGYRLRAAWEVSLMGEGSQVVLPPSTHPDSDQDYEWGANRIEVATDLMELEVGVKSEIGVNDKVEKTDFSFTPIEYDLTTSELSDEIVDLILYADLDDRSPALLKVAIAMVREGLSDQIIMSVLTDTNYELGKVSYEHSKTNNRKKTAEWVFNYTIRKARTEVDARYRFNEEVEVNQLSTEDADKQVGELISVSTDWRDRLRRTDKMLIQKNLFNLIHIFENAIGPNLFKRDVFALKDIYGRQAPWRSETNGVINDDDIIQIKVWLTQQFKIEPAKEMIEDAIGYIAVKHSYHPVRDYLDKLEWDGVLRLDTWLKKYLNTEDMPEPYLSAISRKSICAMVARIQQPGIKYDNVLILNGPQGIGKSTAAQILASEPWFLDRLPDLRDKDSMVNLQGIWVVEMGELSHMRMNTVETYKAYISSQSDKFRLPYGRRRVDVKRQSVMMGSTNPVDFLNDKTGNRRFWTATVRQLLFKEFRRDRDQIIAEAKFTWDNCLEDRIYLAGEEEDQAIQVQRRHVNDDIDSVLEDKFDSWIEKEIKEGRSVTALKLSALFNKVGGAFEDLDFRRNAQPVGALLRSKGYEKDRKGHGGNRLWIKNV